MKPGDPNVGLVQAVARALGALNDRVVFVGGCAAGLLVTDAARPPVRATVDVDLVTEVASRADYYACAGSLRAAGFREDVGEINCRWRHGQLIVDVMPTDEAILGFTNRWYRSAIAHASTAELPDGQQIRLITSPLLIATKLEAFYGRGTGDFGRSHDIEDIMVIVDGRAELLDEIAAGPTEVAEYLRGEMTRLLATERFVSAMPMHFRGSDEEQGRVPIVMDRLRRIAGNG
jgi:predicted nucleotidyltransferase